MSRFIEQLGLAVLITSAAAAVCAQPQSAVPSSTSSHSYANVGRTATPKEIAAWDIDVRPDFKGLPAGSGSVSRGMEIWESTCATCHGTFGESNQVFTPIVGGTTADDIKTGHVAALRDNSQPQRTTLMKVPTVSTLWDYIHRAMPWNAPKSLSNDDVYAVLAYILNLGEIIPSDYVLSNKNIADVQNRMPNRNGMTLDHGLWDVKGKPDVKNVACMKNCPTESKIASSLPAAARGTHGNLAEQNRTFGEVRGVDTVSKQDGTGAPTRTTPVGAKVEDGRALVAKYSCLACHGMTNKIVGPGYNEVAAKYNGKSGAAEQLMAKIRNGGGGNWGPVPMPPQPQVKDQDLKSIVEWILNGAH